MGPAIVLYVLGWALIYSILKGLFVWLFGNEGYALCISFLWPFWLPLLLVMGVKIMELFSTKKLDDY